MAAVNDITARDEQFQQYLNTTNKSIPDHSLDYYSTSSVENMPTEIYTNPTMENSECSPKEMPKTLSLETLANELFPNNCDSPTDEYVDINDMEFIKENNDNDQQKKNILMRRPRRKKTTKRKDDACM